MISAMDTSPGWSWQRLAYIASVALLNLAGALYFAYFLTENGYLPSPFVYDKSDTFMDLFNPMYWAYDAGRYTEWGSIYPPLSFLILKIVNLVFSGGGQGDPFLMRDNSPIVIAGFCLIYLALPVALLATKHWQAFPSHEKVLLYLALILSAPMLFALERGNMIVVCPVLLALALSRIGIARCLCIALLINIKPYFALLLLYYVARENWRGFVTCTVLSGLIFAITGLALDDNFLLFLGNLQGFSQSDAVFSLREVMSLPSSISAFSYVLQNPDGARFASSFLSPNEIDTTILCVEAAKWGVVAIALIALRAKAAVARDAEIFALLVVLISNLGVWVGGYSLIFYATLLPVFLKMRARVLYIGALALIALPLDIIPLRGDFIGMQYSYLADSRVDIYWTLGLGSLLRPFVNLALLLVLSFEFLNRRVKSSGEIPHAASTAVWKKAYRKIHQDAQA